MVIWKERNHTSLNSTEPSQAKASWIPGIKGLFQNWTEPIRKTAGTAENPVYPEIQLCDIQHNMPLTKMYDK